MQDKEKVAYVPIAFVISTEIENHDIFRDMLLELFNSIHNPENVTNKVNGNKKLAFAEMLTHVAYLKTLPSPSINSKMLIEFHEKTLILDEPVLYSIPNRNQIAIETMFEILDVRSILYLWKAIIFDFSLILISSQTSL